MAMTASNQQKESIAAHDTRQQLIILLMATQRGKKGTMQDALLPGNARQLPVFQCQPNHGD